MPSPGAAHSATGANAIIVSVAPQLSLLTTLVIVVFLMMSSPPSGISVCVATAAICRHGYLSTEPLDNFSRGPGYAELRKRVAANSERRTAIAEKGTRYCSSVLRVVDGRARGFRKEGRRENTKGPIPALAVCARRAATGRESRNQGSEESGVEESGVGDK